MTKRKRLIELLNKIQDNGIKIGASQIEEIYSTNAEIADYLLASGVHITVCETCDYIEYKRKNGRTISFNGKPLKYCPECGEELR